MDIIFELNRLKSKYPNLNDYEITSMKDIEGGIEFTINSHAFPDWGKDLCKVEITKKYKDLDELLKLISDDLAKDVPEFSRHTIFVDESTGRIVGDGPCTYEVNWLLKEIGLAKSMSDANRLIEQGAIRVIEQGAIKEVQKNSSGFYWSDVPKVTDKKMLLEEGKYYIKRGTEKNKRYVRYVVLGCCYVSHRTTI